MIIVEKNAGPKIPYEVEGYRITFDDELSLKLNKYQKDEPVHKVITKDSDGDLQIGTNDAKWYVAEIDIPEIQYDVETVPGDEGEDVEIRTAIPLNMDDVTLTLWAIQH